MKVIYTSLVALTMTFGATASAEVANDGLAFPEIKLTATEYQKRIDAGDPVALAAIAEEMNQIETAAGGEMVFPEIIIRATDYRDTAE